jgi:hypothetical protein
MGKPVLSRRQLLWALCALVAAYGIAAYLAAPAIWDMVTRGSISKRPDMLTRTTDGIAGDAINVGLVGSKADVINAFVAAGWHPADPITLKSSIEIGLSVVLDRRYADAPVSPLIFEGRKQDLAFEKPVGVSADRRNHIRIWKDSSEIVGKTAWLASASLDRGVGLSHDTGQITHHIGPDIDAERDLVIKDLEATGMVVKTWSIPGRGATREAFNGEGDPYYTDGLITVAELKPKGS